MMELQSYFLVTGMTIFMVTSAVAQPKLLPSQSEIRFVSKQMGAPVEGRFKKFDANFDFNPTQLQNAKISFTIDLTSVSMGAKETEQEVVKAEWFNTAAFPRATFQSYSVKPGGGINMKWPVN
jgi:polyisoprenoid-binding protein YceI